MKRKFIYILTILFIIILISSYNTTVKAEEENNDNPILFVEEDCSYCQATKDFIEDNSISNKINILYIRENPDNAAFYNKVCENAGISLYERGIPLLYDNDNVVNSADKIIQYLGEKYSLSTEGYELENNNKNTSNKIVFLILGIGIAFSFVFLSLSKLKKK